jgi:hypothetical protein
MKLRATSTSSYHTHHFIEFNVFRLFNFWTSCHVFYQVLIAQPMSQVTPTTSPNLFSALIHSANILLVLQVALHTHTGCDNGCLEQNFTTPCRMVPLWWPLVFQLPRSLRTWQYCLPNTISILDKVVATHDRHWIQWNPLNSMGGKTDRYSNALVDAPGWILRYCFII